MTAAKALTLKQDRRIDRAMTAQFSLPGGATGRIHASMWSSTLLRVRAKVIGDRKSWEKAALASMESKS